MRLKTNAEQSLLRFYTYPVLGDGLSFSSGLFNTDVNIAQVGEDIQVCFKSNLENPQLEKLIQNEQAVFLYHLECSQTCFRKVITSKSGNLEKHIRKGDVEGILEVCSFIVAMDDIPNYVNEGFSEDYRGLSFQIDVGSVLAVGDEFQFRINKKHDDLGYTESIFSIVPDMDGVDKGLLRLDYSGDKIVIMIPEKQYALYEHLQNQASRQPIFMSMVIIPALIEVLFSIAAHGSDEYQDKRWYRSLYSKCNSYNISLDEDFVDSVDPYELAQKLLDYPVVTSIDNIATGSGDEDNED